MALWFMHTESEVNTQKNEYQDCCSVKGVPTVDVCIQLCSCDMTSCCCDL